MLILPFASFGANGAWVVLMFHNALPCLVFPVVHNCAPRGLGSCAGPGAAGGLVGDAADPAGGAGVPNASISFIRLGYR